MQELIQIRSTADSSFNSEDYIKAHNEYKLLVDSLLIKLDKSRTARKVAKASGWVAAILTGGFGLEDFIIVPAVNAAMMKLFGIDLDKFLELLGYSLRQKHVCLCLAGSLAPKVDYLQELNYFVINFKITTRQTESKKDKLKTIFELVNPISNEMGLYTIQQQKSLSELQDMLLEEVERLSPEVDRLNSYLFSFLEKAGKTGSPLFIRLKSKGYTTHG